MTDRRVSTQMGSGRLRTQNGRIEKAGWNTVVLCALAHKKVIKHHFG